MAPSPLAGIVYVSPDAYGQGLVTGTRSHRAPSVAEALAWCDEHGLQVLNRDELVLERRPTLTLAPETL